MKAWIQKLLGMGPTGVDRQTDNPSTTPTAPATSPARVTVRKPAAPTPPPPAPKRNPIKDLLYGDQPLDQWPPPGGSATEVPWSDFAAARHHLQEGRKELAISHWRAVLETPALESLHYMQAWFFLRQNEVRPAPEEAYKILGVVAENGPSGVLTAVYEDGQARLYSDKDQGIVWGHPDASLDPLIESILLASWKIVETVRPWKTAHISLAKSNINSIYVLTPSGFYIKTGPPQTFENDPIVKPVTNGLGLIIQALMEKTGEAK